MTPCPGAAAPALRRSASAPLLTLAVAAPAVPRSASAPLLAATTPTPAREILPELEVPIEFGLEHRPWTLAPAAAAKAMAPRLSIIYTAAGPIPISAGAARGAHGELRLAWYGDRAWAAKELRTRAAPVRPRADGPPTAVSSWATIAAEIAHTAQFVPRLRARRIIYLPRNGKVLVLTELFAGTLADIAPQVPAPMRGCFGRYLMMTLSDRAAKIHAQGVVHGDITPHNVLLGRQGIELADFGKAQVLDGSGCLTRIDGSDAFMAPEMFRALQAPDCRHDRATQVRITPLAEVWSMAMTMMAVFYNGGSPFEDCAMSTLAAAWRQLDSYEAWHGALYDAAGHFVVARVGAGDTCFDRYFGPFARADPSACTLLLTEALQANVGRRASMRQQAARWRALCEEPLALRLQLTVAEDDYVGVRLLLMRAGDYGAGEVRAATTCGHAAARHGHIKRALRALAVAHAAQEARYLTYARAGSAA